MQVLLLVLAAVAPVQEVRDHADAILARQLEDGAIIHLQQGDEITICPYYGNHAALGLFEAYRLTKDKKYLEGGIRWTDWYLKRMDIAGAIPDFKGTAAGYQACGECDATDARAATFLICANTRRMLTSDFRFVLREQGKLFAAHKAMLATLDVDGLTRAKDSSPHKYTAHNAEVYAALWHSRQIAHVLRAYEWTHEAYYTRRAMEKAFKEMRDGQGLYAWAKSGDTTLTVVDKPEFQPAGLANLVTAAVGPTGWHEAKDTVRATYDRFPDLGACSPDQLYWWVAAAQRVHRKDISNRAFDLMKTSVEARGLAVDHAYYIRALASMKHVRRPPKRTDVLMGSTFIDIPRTATR